MTFLERPAHKQPARRRGLRDLYPARPPSLHTAANGDGRRAVCIHQYKELRRHGVTQYTEPSCPRPVREPSSSEARFGFGIEMRGMTAAVHHRHASGVHPSRAWRRARLDAGPSGRTPWPDTEHPRSHRGGARMRDASKQRRSSCRELPDVRSSGELRSRGHAEHSAGSPRGTMNGYVREVVMLALRTGRCMVRCRQR